MASGRSFSIGPFSGGDGNTLRSSAFRVNLVVRHRLGGEDVPQSGLPPLKLKKAGGKSFPRHIPE
ncbi:MAG: hypothetical protein KH745_06565 [Bilophila sp.]|uniref:hypothetical protein n=1 Tax=uncultured Bilophila sp. TaxID=529385 RepID=UPI00280C075A|nr:hypothetical protein [uncultured Bilophila sp.]MBS6142244.1 hypothetical protein [Bilophila sp.]